MLFRFIKKSLKLFIVVYLVLLIFRPSEAKALIDCDASDGSISIVGNEISIEGSEIMEVYSGIEEKASSLVPSGVNKVLAEISEWISNFFSSEK